MNRIQALQKKIKQDQIDGVLITNPYNIRYLANFTGSTGYVLITENNQYFITDFRYLEQAADQCKGYQIVENSTGSQYEVLTNLVKKENIQQLGFEESNVTFMLYSHLQELFEDANINVKLVPVYNFVEELREVKDEEELSIIEQSCAIADQAFEHILNYIQPGMTEIQVANELDFFMRSKGATGVSFDTIVASGARSAMPHGVASDKVIEKGDFITLDYGCYYQGYVSDMTRTISLGNPRDEVLKEIYQIVLNAHLKVEDIAKPGMTGKELDSVARDYIYSFGYGDKFGHSTGHGIGLEIHEQPMISKLSDYKLVENNVITNEPGIYLPGIGGVRIENDLIITKDGHKSLTHSPRELIIL